MYRIEHLDVDFVETNHPVMKFTLNYEDAFDVIKETINLKLLDYLHLLLGYFMEPTDGIANALREYNLNYRMTILVKVLLVV